LNKLTNFDVLIVYAEGMAISSYGKTNQGATPFDMLGRNKDYNVVYGYFWKLVKSLV
jgi:hypothetical protein